MDATLVGHASEYKVERVWLLCLQLTGYSEVEILKTQVTTTDHALTAAKHTAAQRKQVRP